MSSEQQRLKQYAEQVRAITAADHPNSYQMRNEWIVAQGLIDALEEIERLRESKWQYYTEGKELQRRLDAIAREAA